MTQPVRLQLSRKKGFNLQAHSMATNGRACVNCGRPSRWGNGYRLGDIAQRFGGAFPIETSLQAVSCYRNRSRDVLATSTSRPCFEAALDNQLRDRNLACWCAPHQDCHADYLLGLANAPRREERPRRLLLILTAPSEKSVMADFDVDTDSFSFTRPDYSRTWTALLGRSGGVLLDPTNALRWYVKRDFGEIVRCRFFDFIATNLDQCRGVVDRWRFFKALPAGGRHFDGVDP